MKHFSIFSTALLLSLISISATAQSDSLIHTILHHDSIFWQAYNACDSDKMSSYFTTDLEFYHDKQGLTKSAATMTASIKKGLCGNSEWHLRREVIDGTVKIFPMNNLGALISGEHVFYIREGNKEEYLDGYGKFMHLWLHIDGQWKMSRIYSYDHGPAPYVNKRKEVSVPSSTLKKYTGNYRSPHAGVLTISSEGNTLKMTISSVQSTLYPESENRFFLKERDLQFEFMVTKDNATKLIIYEKGKLFDEAIRKQ